MKIRSYLLISFLTIILFFILGVRYGQKVEKTNKVITFVLSITPTQKPTPTKALEFKSFQNTTCGILFIFPSLFAVKETSISGVFLNNNQKQLEFNCKSSSQFKDLFEDPNIATKEMMFKNKKIIGKSINNDNTYLLKIIHPYTNKEISITIQKVLFPLFESSLQFTQK